MRFIRACTQRCVSYIACNDARRAADKVQAVYCLLGRHARQLSVPAPEVCHHCLPTLLGQICSCCLYWLQRPLGCLLLEALQSQTGP